MGKGALDWLSEETHWVTPTAGGNDIGFSSQPVCTSQGSHAPLLWHMPPLKLKRASQVGSLEEMSN